MKLRILKFMKEKVLNKFHIKYVYRIIYHKNSGKKQKYFYEVRYKNVIKLNLSKTEFM